MGSWSGEDAIDAIDAMGAKMRLTRGCSRRKDAADAHGRLQFDNFDHSTPADDSLTFFARSPIILGVNLNLKF